MPDSDPLVIVSDWRFVGIARRSGAARGTFRFTVLARTAGEGLPSWMSTKGRRIRTVKRVQEDVVYCARFVDGKWMLIDPPFSDRPTGSRLFAWRLTHAGAAIFFLTIAGVCLFDQLLSPSVWLFLIGSGVVASFVGVVAWNVSSCAPSK